MEAVISKGLEVENLVVRFGGLTAVDGVDLSVPPGRVTGLIGPNGAGKTTTFNACCGLVSATGAIRLDGRDVARMNPAGRARLGLGRTFQKIELFDTLTVQENVELGHEATVVPKRFGGQLWATKREQAQTRARAEKALTVCDIADLRRRRASGLSTGQKRLVELAMTLVGGFTTMLLDEPSSGLDPQETTHFGKILQQVVLETGAGILLVEHDMALVNGICDYLYVLDFGKPLLDGPTAEVLASDAVAAAYLGA